MNKRLLLRGILFSVASVSGLAMCGAAATMRSASAASPESSASASVSASAAPVASASASVVGPPKRTPPIEPLENQNIPKEKSPVPKFDEWASATVVDVPRRGYEASECVVLRVREWLKIKCDVNVGAIVQHSGTPEGVAFWVRPKMNLWENMEDKNPGEMLFPLRVGDRRMLQFFSLRPDPCVGVGFSPSVLIDETWLEGESGPTVVLR